MSPCGAMIRKAAGQMAGDNPKAGVPGGIVFAIILVAAIGVLRKKYWKVEKS